MERGIQWREKERVGKSLLTASRILFSRKHVTAPDAPRGYCGDNAGEAYIFPTGRSLALNVREKKNVCMCIVQG